MKRWIVPLLAAVLLLGLTACGKKEKEKEPVTGTALFYAQPVVEEEEPEDSTSAALTEEQAKPLYDAIAAVEEWTDDHTVDRETYYFNGTLTFSNAETVYYFSYGYNVVYYDHYYARLSNSFFDTLQDLAAQSGLTEDHFRTEPKPVVEPYHIYDPKVMPEGGQRDGVTYVAYNGVVEHLFFHPIIAYPELAFDGDYMEAGLDDWMVTVSEFNKILDSLYKNNYILVDIGDVWSEATNDAGQPVMVKNTLYLPEGKKPLILSYDDTNYYEYMLENGFTYKLIIGDDGKITSWGLDPQGNEVIDRGLDAIPRLDEFVEEHPDFSPFGAKACLSLTGYEGILGYRTNTDRNVEWTAQREAERQREITAVKPIVEELKRTGWTFGCHTFSHIRLGSVSLERIKDDLQRWLDEVGSLVGETSIIFYPYGDRPDGDDWKKTGEAFKYIQSKGFRVFASVGIEPFSYIKKDICAVICDRMHPDGTTMRKRRTSYMRFYDSKEVFDASVRPSGPQYPFGSDWNE